MLPLLLDPESSTQHERTPIPVLRVLAKDEVLQTPFAPLEDAALLKAAAELGGATLVIEEKLWKPLYYSARKYGKLCSNTSYRTPRAYMKR